MGDYFKPWRRKIGVMTLVMACVLMAVWIRSCAVTEYFHVFGLRFVSADAGLERSTVTFRGIGPGGAANDYTLYWRIPYWSIAIPLTLLSAYLLLSSPRKTNVKQVSQPLPENAT